MKLCEQCKEKTLKKGAKKFCSLSCYGKYLHISGRGSRANNWRGGGVIKVCPKCNKEFEVKKCQSKIVCCSISCSKRGTIPWNKKYFDMSPMDKIRQSPEYKVWRNFIYKKDNWSCRQCGKKCSNKEIIAHHLKYANWSLKDMLKTENGIVLCRGCHLNLHKANRPVENIFKNYFKEGTIYGYAQ
ncbi:hypothetical protein M0R04_10655 [Candidatus Dojkabacteria bacterium]|jgi:hypothetical protein|nr:hypothetical protein [Candidatus Dojkabacteria bacterium]